MDDSRAEFDSHDMQLLVDARRDTEKSEQTEGEKEESPADLTPTTGLAPGAAPTAPAAVPAAPDAAASAATPAPPAQPLDQRQPAEDAQGNTKAALRAARHDARRLRDENEALRQRLDEVGSDAKATPATAIDAIDEGQLKDVREYAPAVGRDYDRLRAENADLRARVPEPVKPFRPIEFDPVTQAAIDEVPELLLWHSSEEHQDEMQAAIGADMALATAAAWKGKPLAERFAHAVKVVQRERAAPSKASTPKTLEDAQRAIDAAPSATAGPVSLGDLRGGASATTGPSFDPAQMIKAGKSDDEIIASLPVMP